MTRNEIIEALDALGTLCSTNTELVVVGGAAGILCRWMERATMDVDVAAAIPRLSALAAEVTEVAEALGLPERWINDGAKAFAQVLPPDYRERLLHVGSFGRLEVYCIGRIDFVTMKLYAMRAEDIQDLQALQPTRDELDFVTAQLPRIAAFEPRRAHLMELYLAQGGDS